MPGPAWTLEDLDLAQHPPLVYRWYAELRHVAKLGDVLAGDITQHGTVNAVISDRRPVLDISTAEGFDRSFDLLHGRILAQARAHVVCCGAWQPSCLVEWSQELGRVSIVGQT